MVVVPNIPRFDHAGGDRRLVEILTVIGRRCDICMLATRERRDDDAPYERALTEQGVQLLGHDLDAGVQVLLRHSFSAVFFEFYFTTVATVEVFPSISATLMRVARSLQPQAIVIVDSVDLSYMREREAARLGQLSAESVAETERVELEAYRAADVAIAVSDAERTTLLEKGIADVRVIPIIVPIIARTVRPRSPSVLFVGGFDHLPNRFAVDWFHREIWPRVRLQIPEVTWTIAGSNTPPQITRLHGTDGIEVLGFVATTEALLDATELSVAPLTFGAGMKSKVCEALGAGVPVVTTSWGAQGLEPGIGNAFRVADDAHQFANEIVRLLRNRAECESLGKRGQDFVATVCSPAVTKPAIDALVDGSCKVRRRFGGYPRRALALRRLVAERKAAGPLTGS